MAHDVPWKGLASVGFPLFRMATDRGFGGRFYSRMTDGKTLKPRDDTRAV
jgi:hypothetical protein